MASARIALVTGANSGIGRAIASRLVQDGFAVAAHSRDPAKVVDELGAAAWVCGDLSDPLVPERLVTRAVEQLGRLDVLVNNAGTTLSKPAEDIEVAEFDSIFAVDVRAAFLLARAAFPAMREQRGGSIVNVTSVHEHVPRTGFAIYAAGKAALGMLTKSLALEWAEHGIRVNSVAPGAIATERNRADVDALGSHIPLGRAGEPDEVAALVSWLASDGASYVTGGSYLVDGGFVLRVMSR